MSRRRWQAWVAVLAVGLGVTAARPAEAGPPGKAPAAASAETEAKQLAETVGRLYGQGKYEEALPLAERAVALQEKMHGPHHPDFAWSLNDLGLLCWARGDRARAESLHLRALAILEKVLAPDDPDLADVVNTLATLYLREGDLTRAEPLYLRALAILEKARGPDHPDVANVLNNLAGLYVDRRDYERAEPRAQRALAIREKALGHDHPDVAGSLVVLADLYRARGDRARAEPIYQRALAIREKTLGPDHPDVAGCLNEMAALYEEKGDYARAESLYLRALAIFEKAHGPDHAFVGVALNNLAQLYQERGDHARAETLYQRALAIFEKARGPDHPDVGIALNNLALLYEAEQDPARAEPLYLRALPILEKGLGPDHPKLASCVDNLGLLYQRRGDYARAEPLHQRALAIRERTLGPDHPDVALSLNNLALLYAHEGDVARAEPLYQRARTVFEIALGPDHPRLASCLDNLAALHVLTGRLPEAVSDARRAADIQDRNAAVLLAVGSEEQRRLYMSTLVAETDQDVSLHVESAPAAPDAARLALTVLLRRKGRVLDAMTDGIGALRRSLSPDDAALLDRLAGVYGRVAAQVTRGPGSAPPEQYRGNLAALEEARQSLEADVGRRSATFRSEQRLVTLADVQAKIPPGAALVEIARHATYRPRTGLATPSGPPRYVAYVLRPSGDPTFADLGEAAPLEAAVDAFRRALGDPDHTHDPKPAARALDRLLMAPVRALLGETRWVFMSPDGALNLVPFGALVDEAGHYLVERYLFSYLTSGRDLLRLGDDHPPSREPPLILANPAFDDAGTPRRPEATHRALRSIDMVTHALLPLEGTAEEARTIARLFPDSRVLLGAQATDEAVKAAHAPRLLHLATHGFFLPEQPVPDALVEGRGAGPTPAERAALLQRESPLLRSGIALAGFNKRKDGSDPGVLTALEAAGLDLYGTRLVVLSTCESGLGEASAGEGVYGMRRALTMAGAETQVMSLWQVDTGRTRELMGAYYQRLKDGAGRSEAMRAVQLAMLDDARTASPNLWASFIVSGEWRPLEGGSRLPDLGRVAPGVRGCACGQAGGEPRDLGASAAVALALALALGGRRRGA